MLKKISLLIFLTALFLFSGCSSTNTLQNLSHSEAKRIADEYFYSGKYKKAIPYYKKIVNESSSAFLAESQFRLADCYFQRREFIDARFEYQEFIRRFSGDPKVAEAFFQIGVCYYELSAAAHYDQTETFSAIDAFSDYLDKFPFHEKKKEALEYIEKARYKLLEKRFYNGYAYFKMSDYPAALLYFNDIIELDNLNELDLQSLYYSALIYIYRKDLTNTEIMFTQLNNKYPDARETAKISPKKDKLEKEIKK
jgi:outer membrane protein assembly factor BamD